MRPVLICVFLTICLVLAMAASSSSHIPSGLTVIMDFQGAHSDHSIGEMERESAAILKTTGIALDWRFRNQTLGQAYPDLVVMTFTGSCKFDPAPWVYDVSGPLARTITTDHVIQPFGEVDCNHVVETARSAMASVDYVRADMLVGRALGRVVVHEIVHMLTHSAEHGREGVFKATLSGKQLIAPSLPLSAMDVERLMPGYEGEQ